MDQEIRDRYQTTILDEAMRRYGILPGQVRPLKAFESFIFEFERDGMGLILRLNHSLRRNEALILGEVDWISCLAAGGVPAARAVPSPAGQLVEAIDDGQGGQFLATAFVQAQGRPPWEVGWTPARYKSYGRLLGSMHALAEGYRPADPAWKRPEWDDSSMEFVERYLPESEETTRQIYRSLCDHLRSLPRDPGCYGLIHQDAHEANLLMDEAGNLTLFDFDECAYSWFANDIAICLFYIALDAEDPAVFTRTFMTPFLDGYRQVYQLEPRWLVEIPVFLKMRELELYAVMHRDFDVQAIDDPWCARFMQGRKARIEGRIPTIDFDFETLAV